MNLISCWNALIHCVKSRTTWNCSEKQRAQILKFQLKKLTSGDPLEIAAQQSSSSGQGLDVETQILFTGQKV